MDSASDAGIADDIVEDVVLYSEIVEAVRPLVSAEEAVMVGAPLKCSSMQLD